MARSAVSSSSLLLLGRLNRLETNPTGPEAAYRRASLRTWRDVSPSRSAARYGFKSPSTTAWIHFNRSRSRIANVALVYCLIADLQVPVGDQEISAQQVESGHLNLA